MAKSASLKSQKRQHHMGYAVRQRKLDRPLRIQGVGNGTNEGKWEISTPIAVPVLNEEGEPATELFEFVSPSIEGQGKDLPLILGLKSMTEKSGVLEMQQGRRALTFPGPGGYEIKWAPGAVRIPLQDAMSKHAMIPCARFQQLQATRPQGGLPSRKMTFHATKVPHRDEAHDTQEQNTPGASSSTCTPGEAALAETLSTRQGSAAQASLWMRADH